MLVFHAKHVASHEFMDKNGLFRTDFHIFR